MARGKCLLDGGFLAVDTSVQGTAPEEGGFGAASVEDVDELRGVCVWTVVVGKCQHVGLAAFADDDAGVDGSLDVLQWAHHWEGAGARDEQQPRGEGFCEHID